LLSALIKADGFDTGFGDYTAEQWRILVKGAANRAGVHGGSSVLEIGCGSGAFLYELERLTSCRVTGIDFSRSLVNDAARHIPFGDFIVCDAANIPLPNEAFDAVLSHAVLYYFSDLIYVRRVLHEAYAKLRSGGRICLMDLNDKDAESRYHESRKRHFKDPKEYDRRYSGLEHLFFDRASFASDLREAGFVGVEFFNHDVPEYVNSKFRFNVIATKR
jgi:SAM-dependent methyltransferase